jgi:diguanylate cyclase
MGTWALKVLFVGIGTLVGAAAGWWIRGAGLANKTVSQEQPQPEPRPEPTPEPEPVEEQPDFDAVEEMMVKLQQLTATVAADVGEHNSRVQEINEELSAGDGEGDVIAVVEKLIKANETMQSQLEQAEERLQKQSSEIETHVMEARTDALTMLWNRRHFDDEIEKCKEAFVKSQRPSCVFMLDVDHFKKFNDTYGHQAGDEVLKEVARTMQSNVASKEIVCRYGGEEFAIIFPGSDIEAAMASAERARAAIAEQVVEFEGLELQVTASGGLAQFQSDETAKELVKRSDDALYVCKEAGRNCGHWHDGTDSHPIELSKDELNAAVVEEEHGHDPVTGLSDQKSLTTDIDRRIADWKRGGSGLSILMVEIDRFDGIRDAYGEQASQIVLRAAAQYLKAAMREMDHVAQYDEHVFGLLLPGTEISETSIVAERLRGRVARCTLPLDGEKLVFTISLGAAQVCTGDETQTLLERAKSSLEAAKEAGGNCSFSAQEDGEVCAMQAAT